MMQVKLRFQMGTKLYLEPIKQLNTYFNTIVQSLFAQYANLTVSLTELMTSLKLLLPKVILIMRFQREKPA